MSQELCFYCMRRRNPEYDVCPHCGHRNQDIRVADYHLRPGSVLDGKYILGRVLGEGGFGITYIGFDRIMQERVAIKEYCPKGYAYRDSSGRLMAADPKVRGFFEDGRYQFIEEARRLAKCRQMPGVVTVAGCFEENGTAYIVMEYIEGETLRDYLGQKKTLSAEETLNLLRPVVLALSELHKQNIVHCDISPDNIMLYRAKNGEREVRLVDFGSARNLVCSEQMPTEQMETEAWQHRTIALNMDELYTARSTRKSRGAITLKRGYAPVEQYSGKQGQWTDVYALCATMYRCMTGQIPQESTDRKVLDELKKPSELHAAVPPRIEKVLMKGLAVEVKDRIRDMDELYRLLYQKKRNILPLICGSAAVLCLLVALGSWRFLANRGSVPVGGSADGAAQSSTTEAETTVSESPAETEESAVTEPAAEAETESTESLAETKEPATAEPAAEAETEAGEAVVETKEPVTTEETAETETAVTEAKPVTETTETAAEPIEKTMETAASEPVTEAETAVSEAMTEAQTEAPASVTEAQTEAPVPVTEAQTEAPAPVTETQTAAPAPVTETQTAAPDPVTEAEQQLPADSAGQAGSYVTMLDEDLVIHIPDIDGVQKEIPGTGAVYMDAFKEENGRQWGHVSYCGYDGWLDLENMRFLSANDYSLRVGAHGFITDDYKKGIALRSEASGESERLTRLPYGTELVIEEFQNGWARVTVNGQGGWVLTDCLSTFDRNLLYVMDGSEEQRTLYAEPSAESSRIGVVDVGVRLGLLEYGAGWGKTQYNGQTGWVKLSGLKAAAEAEGVQETETVHTTEAVSEAIPTYSTAYCGSYTAAEDGKIAIHIPDIGGIQQEIPGSSVVYIDAEKEEDGRLWGHTSYCGYDGWIDMRDIYFVSEENCAVQTGMPGYISSGYKKGIALRSEPDGKSDLLDRLSYGTEFILEEFQNGWARVSVNGRSGWVTMDCVSAYYANLVYEVSVSDATGTWLRTIPTDDAQTLDEVANGTVISFTEYRNGWGKTQYNGQSGWLKLLYMRLSR